MGNAVGPSQECPATIRRKKPCQMVKILPTLPQMANKAHFTGAAWVPDKQAQEQAFKASGQTKADTYDIVIQAATLLTSTIEGAYYDHPIKTTSYGAQAGVDGAKLLEGKGEEALKKLSGKRNPLFDEYAIETGGQSPVTQNYLTSRRWKKLDGSAFQTLGNLLSLAPPTAGVNIPGTIYHGQATGLTAMHMARIGYIANTYSKAQQVQDWCKLVEAMKAIKLGVRGSQLVGSVVPLASMPTAIAAAVIKTGVKLTTTGACFAAAAQLHWIAYNEQVAVNSIEMLPMGARPASASGSSSGASTRSGATAFYSAATHQTTSSSRPSSPPPALQRAAPLTPKLQPKKVGREAGPASAIVWEIFTKRGATRVFGAYDVAALVREPAGWMALGDKLMLI